VLNTLIPPSRELMIDSVMSSCCLHKTTAVS